MKVLKPLIFSCTKPQLEIFRDESRFKLVVAGRRFGKTFLSKYDLVAKALKRPKSLIWYVAPTYRQAKELMWGPLKEFLPKVYISHKNETELSLTLVNGSEIKLKGADNPDSLRGNGLDHVVLDEMAFQAPYVWEVLRPALADKKGSMLGITTPAGFGWFYDLVVKYRDTPDWAYFHFTSLEGGNIPPEEIEAARRDMDPRKFKQEMEASFESLAGRVYYAFELGNNISYDFVGPKPNEIIHVGIDFNVNPMSAAVAVRRGPELVIFDEITIADGNTDLLAQEIKTRYPNRAIVCYPDPTGASRKTSATGGVTDHSILRGHGFQVYTPGSPYPVSTKINTVNRGLCNADGERRIFTTPNTKVLQKSWLGLTYLEGTSIPDPRSDCSHMCDAAGYMILALLPMTEPLRYGTVTH